jgi:hypothetical protein
MGRSTTLCVVVAVTLLGIGAVAAEDERKPSEDLSYATYGESGGRVKAVVSSVAAKIEKPEEFLPLQIAIGVKGEGPQVSFTYQTFQLIDGEGNYAASSTPEDIQGDLKFWMETQRMREMRPIQTANYFSSYTQVASNLYPKTGGWGGTRLNQNSAFQDVVFFPLPKSLDGVMTLVVMGEGMDDPVKVNFEIPHKHKNHEE